MKTSPKRKERIFTPPILRFLPVIILLAVFVALAISTSFLCDDAFISFRYARNLAEGQGLVFNPGERVEGYTNFLWVIMIAAVIKLGGMPEIWSRIISIACSGGTLLLFFLWERSKNSDWRIYAVFPAFLAFMAPFIIWSTGGLETAAATLFLFAAILSTLHFLKTGSLRLSFAAGALVAAAVLARPDAILAAGIMSLYLLISVLRKNIRWRLLIGYLLFLAVPLGAHEIWRLAYYGKWLPNTFYAKTPALEFLPFGWRYLRLFAIESALWFPLALVLFLLWQFKRRRITANGLFLLGIILVYVGWTIYTGGDFMVMGRFLIPIVPIIFLFFSELIGEIKMPRTIIYIMVVGLLAGHFAYSVLQIYNTNRRDSGERLDSIRLLRDYRDKWTDAARLLQQIARPTDTIVTSAAGIIPYYTNLHAVDVLGLTARDFSRYRQRPHHRRPGHSLSIRPDELLAMRPQFLINHPTVRQSDSAYFSFSTFEDARADIMQLYNAVSMPLPNDQSRRLFFLLRKDLTERYGTQMRVYTPRQQ